MHRAVKAGTIAPGQYLVLRLDFSSISCPSNVDLAAERLRRGINKMMDRFKKTYNKYLHNSPAWREISQFESDDPAQNLCDLVTAVDNALQHIHDGGDENHPLFNIKGVCLF